ncbi:Hemicentin-2, partial [Stegodyphus mimosarum]
MDGNCFLEKKFAKNCSLSCPSGMKKNADTGDCEPNEGSEKCNKDCGYGWCVRKDKEDKCICISTYSELKDGKCVLKKEVCASKTLTEDSMRCDCKGRFKYSENKITCEKKSCSDEEVQNICKEMGAEKCKDTWTSSSSSYECKCKSGYEKENGICTDVCSLVETKQNCGGKGQFCYISDLQIGHCSCPPLFTLTGNTCTYLASSSLMLKQLPVISKKYLHSKTAVDYVKLSVDIFKTMEAMYPYFEYASVSKYKLDGDVIKTDVLLQFKRKTSFDETGRIKIQKLNTNCSDAEDSVLFPPSLCLRNGSIEDVKYDFLDVCKAKDSLCGPYAECNDNKCRCPKGFRISEYGAKRGTGNAYEIVRCEDIDECKDDLHSCSANTTCVNTPGDFYCKCKHGYKKKGENVPYENKLNKDDCVDLCNPNPCGDNGVCSLKDNKMFDCSCKTGYEGTLCDRNDVAYANAKKGTTVVGAVLGVILAICLIAFFLYVRRIRKNSDSEDFSPVPTRQDNAEMTERRPVRGVTNRGYQ